MPFDGAFSPLHWLIVAVVVLLVLGPDKLPDAARSAARFWREFQGVRHHLVSELRDLTSEVTQQASDNPPAGDGPSTATVPLPAAEPVNGDKVDRESAEAAAVRDA
jgi:TatA/E family protein of Tat protein translocase